MSVYLFWVQVVCSHDPPTPQMGSVPPEVEEFLIAGRNPTEEARNARQAKLLL